MEIFNYHQGKAAMLDYQILVRKGTTALATKLEPLYIKGALSVTLEPYDPDVKNPTTAPTILNFVHQDYNLNNLWSTQVHLHGQHMHFNKALLSATELDFFTKHQSAIFVFSNNFKINQFTITNDNNIAGTSEYFIAVY
jgi:hypothetical protein